MYSKLLVVWVWGMVHKGRSCYETKFHICENIVTTVGMWVMLHSSSVSGRVLDWVIDGLKTTSADSGSVLDEEWDDEDIATDGVSNSNCSGGCSGSNESFFFFCSSGLSSGVGRWNGFEYYNYSTLCCPIIITSSSFNHTLSISLLHESFHLVFCLPLHLFLGTGASNILLSTCPSSLLLTCPYHFSLFSVIFVVTGATFTDRLTCSFLRVVYLWQQ